MMYNREWTDAAAELARTGTPYAIATVLATAGSTPREGGTKMVISAEHTYASIGGGQLEFLVVQRARELILAKLDCQEIKQFPLGAEAKQCCGGMVTVVLECFAASQIPLVLFGAGHVAQALVPILRQLPYSTTWIDSRDELFQGVAEDAKLRCRVESEPNSVISELPEDTYILVLTHDHALDYRIVRAALEEPRFGFLGLIGSENKARRFRARLKQDGISPKNIDLLRCPVGLSEVKGKLPMEIAVSIAAQLIQLNGIGSSGCRAKALNWKQMKTMLNDPSSGSAEKIKT